jgi:hypothetical protein
MPSALKSGNVFPIIGHGWLDDQSFVLFLCPSVTLKGKMDCITSYRCRPEDSLSENLMMEQPNQVRAKFKELAAVELLDGASKSKGSG